MNIKFQIEYRREVADQTFARRYDVRNLYESDEGRNLEVVLGTKRYLSTSWMPEELFMDFSRERFDGLELVQGITRRAVTCDHGSLPILHEASMTHGHVLCGHCHLDLVNVIKAQTNAWAYVCEICAQNYWARDVLDRNFNRYVVKCLGYRGHFYGVLKGTKDTENGLHHNYPFFVHGLGTDDYIYGQVKLWEHLHVDRLLQFSKYFQ